MTDIEIAIEVIGERSVFVFLVLPQYLVLAKTCTERLDVYMLHDCLTPASNVM